MPLTIQHAKSDTIADWTGTVTVGNSSGGSASVLATNIVRPSDWNSAHNLTLSLTGSEIASLFSFNNGLSSATGAGGLTAGLDTLGYFEPLPVVASNMVTAGIGTWYFDPFFLPFALTSGQIGILMAVNSSIFKNGAVYSSVSTGSVTLTQTISNKLALYQLGTGANTTRLESIWSADCSMLFTWERRVTSSVVGGTTTGVVISNFLTASFPAQWNTAGGVTYSSTSQSGSTSTAVSTAASTLADNLITGVAAYITGSRFELFPFATTLPAGDYWLANMYSSSSSSSGTNYSTGTMMTTQSRVYVSEFVGQGFKRLGQSVSNSSSMFQQFHGSYASTSTVPPTNVGTSDMRNLASNQRIYWNWAQSSY